MYYKELQMTEQFSLRLSKETKEKLQELAISTGRTKSYLAQDAIKKYLEHEAWQIQTIKEGINDVENNDVISVEEVKRNWGIE